MNCNVNILYNVQKKLKSKVDLPPCKKQFPINAIFFLNIQIAVPL